jgi:hypothetical protein
MLSIDEEEKSYQQPLFFTQLSILSSGSKNKQTALFYVQKKSTWCFCCPYSSPLRF